jgi:hypothetical protein
MLSISTSDWIALAAVAIAIASFWVAQRTLQQMEDDWRQKVWFDLFLKADEAYNMLDYYQSTYANQHAPQTQQQAADWTKLIFHIRRLHSMGLAFPPNWVGQELFSATTGFEHSENAFDENRLSRIFDASHYVLSQAKLNASLLKHLKTKQQITKEENT